MNFPCWFPHLYTQRLLLQVITVLPDVYVGINQLIRAFHMQEFLAVLDYHWLHKLNALR
jgi:hypothetical protein